MTRHGFVKVIVVVMMALLGAASVDAQLAWFDPVSLVIPTVGGNADLTVRIQGVPDLWGVDFWVTWDPAIFGVIAPIGVGVCPAPDIPLANTVDNGAGVAHYAVSAFTAGPCDTVAFPDQVAATFTFTRLALGYSRVDFSLADPPGISILANNSVEVCNETTPLCWQNAYTDWPVELMAISVD